MYEVACSWRVWYTRTRSARRASASKAGSSWTPGSPKTTRMPWACSDSTSRSAPLGRPSVVTGPLCGLEGPDTRSARYQDGQARVDRPEIVRIARDHAVAPLPRADHHRDVDDVGGAGRAAHHADRARLHLVQGHHLRARRAEQAGEPGLPGPAAPRLRHDPGRHG